MSVFSLPSLLPLFLSLCVLSLSLLLSPISPDGDINDQPWFNFQNNNGQPVGIWWCNFFPNPGNMIVYPIPLGANPQQYVPPSTGEVPYGDCRYFPQWGVAGQIIQIASVLQTPQPNSGSFFFQVTPITVDGNGNGVSLYTNTIVYFSEFTLRTIPPLPANDKTNNPEAENQNIFIAIPLAQDPPNLALGYAVQAFIPPFAYVNSIGQFVVSWLLTSTIGRINVPSRRFLLNLAPGIGNTDADLFNVPGYANAVGPHTFDGFITGGASPNVYYNANTFLATPTLFLNTYGTNVFPFYNFTDVEFLFAQFLVTPLPLGGNSMNGFVTNTIINDVAYSAFGGFYMMDFNAIQAYNDPGFWISPFAANTGGALGTQIGSNWHVHGNVPPFSVSFHTVFGLGNFQYPYQTKTFVFSRLQQLVLQFQQAFISNAILFGQKNNLNMNLLQTTTATVTVTGGQQVMLQNLIGVNNIQQQT